jgi:hypothetical protein
MVVDRIFQLSTSYRHTSAWPRLWRNYRLCVGSLFFVLQQFGAMQA